MPVTVTFTVEVDDEYADAEHPIGITEEANDRLFGPAGFWLGEIIDGPNKVSE